MLYQFNTAWSLSMLWCFFSWIFIRLWDRYSFVVFSHDHSLQLCMLQHPITIFILHWNYAWDQVCRYSSSTSYSCSTFLSHQLSSCGLSEACQSFSCSDLLTSGPSPPFSLFFISSYGKVDQCSLSSLPLTNSLHLTRSRKYF